MAFVCDLTRVATLMISSRQSNMNLYAPLGIPSSVHGFGHSYGTDVVSKALAWHVKFFAYLVAKLRDTPEGDGHVLDNCALVFLTEGGHGLDAASGKQYSSHSSENMAVLVAGHAGGLRAGQHVAAPGMHPANVLVTAMNAVGVAGDTLGEVSGTIPGLL
jgi:hypothetical protein